MLIGICDDEYSMREIIARKIKSFCSDIKIKFYENGEALIEEMPDLDILLLDIKMPGKNGMEAAKILRENKKNTVIIFVTGVEDYVFRAFDVEAFHYLIKPFSDEKFETVIKKAILKSKNDKIGNYKKEEKNILIKAGRVYTKIKVDDIIYAEVYNRKITIHSIENDIEYYGKMTDLEKQVGDSFFRPHRAYLVNMKYVSRYDSATIYLEKGTVIMAKQNYHAFVKSYLRYNQGMERE